MNFAYDRQLHKSNDVILSLFRILLLFFTVYNSSGITSYTFISTSRVVLLVMLLYLGVKKRGKIGINRDGVFEVLFSNWKFQVFLLVYSILLLFFIGSGNGETLISPIIDFLVTVPLFYLSATYLYDNEDELMRDLIIISVIQGIILFACLFNSGIASLIDSTFNSNVIINQGRGYTQMRAGGYNGGLACITSLGALKMSLGILGCGYFFLKGRQIPLLSVCFLFITAASATTARTGLIVSVIVLLFVLIWSIKVRQFAVLKIIISLIVIMALFFLFFYARVSQLLPSTFRRIFELLENGMRADFFDAYWRGTNTEVPPLSLQMVFGIGITSGTAGNGITIHADGNFRRMYAAIGLPLAIVFYYVIIRSMMKCSKLLETVYGKFACFLFLTLMFIGEFKEPFFYSLYLYELFFVFVALALRNNEQGKTRGD